MKDHSIVVFGPLQDFARPQTDLEDPPLQISAFGWMVRAPCCKCPLLDYSISEIPNRKELCLSSFLRKPLKIQRKNKIRNKLEQVE